METRTSAQQELGKSVLGVLTAAAMLVATVVKMANRHPSDY